MGTPIAFASGTTNSFNLGTTKRGTIALNTGTNLTSGYNWWNGVDVSATQYIIYSDTFSQGQATIATARPTAWTTPDLNDSSLLALINTLPDRVGQGAFTDINVALQWLEDSEKYFLIKGGYNNIVTSNLVVNLDAGWANSYPGTGTNWNDLTSSNLDGTIINGVSFSSDGGGSLQTDGSDDYVLVGPVPGTGGATSSVSWEIWVNPADTDGNIMSMSSQNPQGGWNMPPIAARGGVFQAKIWQNSILSDTVGYTQGQWYQLVLVWDYSAGQQRFYVNGVLKSSEAGIEYGSSGVNNYLFLGQQNPGADGAGMFAGKYGQFRVYNKALNNLEVLQNFEVMKYRYGYGGQSLFSGVTQYFDFSKTNSYPGSGTDLFDISGNGFNSSITDLNFTTIEGVKCLNCATGSQINGNISNSPTLGNSYTIMSWARVISSTVAYRTLFRTYDDDHPLLVLQGSNLIGYYDNNGGNFVSSGLDIGTLGLAERWVLYTIVGSGGNTQTFYINDGANSGSVNYAASGEIMDDICNHSGQIFGPVANTILYNNQSFTQAQVEQYYEATKQYYGYTQSNVLSFGLVLDLDSSNTISYPGSGTVWSDLTGLGNNCTFLNGPTYSTSNNGVINFDGTDDYGTIQRNSSLSPTTGITQESWVNFDANQTGVLIGLQYGTSSNNSYALWYQSGSFRGGVNINGGFDNQGYGFTPTVGVWYHLVHTWDGSTQKLFINGSLVRSWSTSGTISYISNNDKITIGADFNGSGYNTGAGAFVSGEIARIRIYNRGLTNEEVAFNYNAEKSIFGY